MNSWISYHPQWFVSECESISRDYPHFHVWEGMLREGALIYFGELVIRPPGGSKRQAVCLAFPNTSPYAFPTVTPIEQMPEFTAEGSLKAKLQPKFFDRRHQMACGGLCLFQQETRGTEGGDSIRAVDVLKRAERWLIGHFTGHWPPDSQRSELESHFERSGDILLGERLFDSDLVGRGEFLAVRDVHRVLINHTNDKSPLLVTSITDEGSGVAAVHDARQGLEPIFPWLENDSWKPERFSELDEKQRSDNYLNAVVSRGFWWTLQSEPSPFRNGAGLLRELDAIAPDGDSWKLVSDAMSSSIATESHHLIGLKYPARTGDWAWLIVQLETESAKSSGDLLLFSRDDQEKRRRFERGRISCLRSHAVRPADIQLRNETVVKPTVSQKTVALVGLGALGSKVAELLAQAGVGKFRLCDYDRLTIGNVSRHIGGLHEFGSPKIGVVASRILEINSFASIEDALFSPAASDAKRFVKFCENADVVISTIADEGAESAVNQLAVGAGVTMIYGRAMRRGRMGRIFIVRPGKDACKACLSKYANEPTIGEPAGWIGVAETDGDPLFHECGRPVIPASAVDLSFVAALIARKALDVLEGNDSSTNHLVWSRDAAADVDHRFEKPFGVVETTFSPLELCPVCQQPPIADIEISESIKAEIVGHVEESPNVETGGVLIGYVDGRTAIVTRITGPGPKALRTAIRFERDVEYVQQQIDLAAIELGGQGSYLGEWHSHLEPDPEPSGQDIRSMVGISAAPNYSTDCPLMVIAGFDVHQAKATGLRAWSFPRQGQVHRAAIATAADGNVQPDVP